ncbi:T6SS amidase immunity protein Tai4 family protein [Taylorella equigenitalis]|uniref:T6SS amidase immunity protein Tai4 family protein n=1 Tax=Taylorella equigenitalis TaxID=29575 RepID=UPI000DD75433|nr:T6SS amidase immunity protein Tai4 family protein [Taylorella equigenitalis]RBA26954.1 hypothetical protein DQW13_00450 [Taylorella equigenitalis]WDU48642.1 type VI secretion system amidase immunity protein Tai4 [Taylorella equigenitalis]
MSHDIAASYHALDLWALYDLDNGPSAVTELSQKYLARRYEHPMDDLEEKPKYTFLKCMDLFYSKELDDLAKKYIDNPYETYIEYKKNMDAEFQKILNSE